MRIGIVSWNTADLLDRALASLSEATGTLDAEVVVVDNASDDASIEVARSHKGVEVVVRDSNVGYARAMNEALGGTEARALIALNPDTEAPPGSLERLVSTLDERPEAGLVAPALVGSDGLPQRSIFPYPGVLQALETGFVPRRCRRDALPEWGDSVRTLHGRWVHGAVHCIRRVALGGEPAYSTRWFMYVEDIELCWRLEAAGWSNLICEDVTVLHHGNAAGSQRWGEGADLELLSLPNIYEWLWSDRSPHLGRATALINVLGVGTKRWILELACAGQRGPIAEARRSRARELKRLAGYHARVLRGGPTVQPAGATSPSS